MFAAVCLRALFWIRQSTQYIYIYHLAYSKLLTFAQNQLMIWPMLQNLNQHSVTRHRKESEAVSLLASKSDYIFFKISLHNVMSCLIGRVKHDEALTPIECDIKLLHPWLQTALLRSLSQLCEVSCCACTTPIINCFEQGFLARHAVLLVLKGHYHLVRPDNTIMLS